jgi:Rhodococcus equi virulence-associated protein
MNRETVIDRQTVLNNYAEFSNAKMDAALDIMPISLTKYPAYASFPWIDFTYIFTVNFSDSQVGKAFSADVFGMGGPLNGFAVGDVATDNLQRLVNKTVSYQFNGTSSNFKMNFFDENSNLLGTFKCENFLLLGVGGGIGVWV